MALSCSSFSIIFLLSLRNFRESNAAFMPWFFSHSLLTLHLQICVWKQTFSPGKDERYRLTFDWRFSALSQSEIRVHWWTHNSKNPTNLGRRKFNSTLYQSSHGFPTRVHGCATKTNALVREIPPATQANLTPNFFIAKKNVLVIWNTSAEKFFDSDKSSIFCAPTKSRK